MERRLSVVPGHALLNPLAGDRHYEGLSATDGTNIGSRSAHRGYMRNNGLTMAEDFKGVWSAAAAERAAIRTGAQKDPEIRKILEKEIHTHLAT